MWTRTRSRGKPDATAAAGSAARFRPRLPRLDGLRGRLVITVVVVALISAVTATGLAYQESRDAVLKRAQSAAVEDFRNRVDRLAAELDVPTDPRTMARFASDVSSGLRGSLVVAQYRDYTASSDPSADRTRITPELRAAVRTRSRISLQRVQHGGKPWLVLGAPVGLDSAGPRGSAGRLSGVEVFAVVSLAEEARDTADLVRSVQHGLVPVLLLSAVLALLAARTVLRPVRRLARATRRLATGELTIRVEEKGRDELAELAHTFNETAGALEHSVGELRAQEALARRFVADVSHELRTPLAAMTMVSSVLEEDADQLTPDAAHAARTVSAETARLARLVDDLIEISRFDARAVALTVHEVDLAEAVRGTLAARGWTDRVEADLPPGIRARLDRRRLDVIIANLVGNALRHGAPPVTVTVRAADGQLTLTVTDHGPGLAPEVAPHVFDRFYKADGARTRSEGSGLGMAIALENARLHGGTIELAPPAPDAGAVFVLRLPHRTESAS
ncbi:two-component sensor histidine kinase [Streptomyces glebosus]|uniref:histidine kinase n=1 Tax=Streptomyces glebosus TaxID=249580 RepID=A0A640SXC6_9ACTN|nr:HAMP domain-containing sensor histidine kinase [Streptomyces glebosus]GFE15698.1 two-component sensor histidine kinase [Streptomyces glebosus]GHG52101.1 two-component sensor histidine kinase [Streptomyces glebosus]